MSWSPTYELEFIVVGNRIWWIKWGVKKKEAILPYWVYSAVTHTNEIITANTEGDAVLRQAITLQNEIVRYIGKEAYNLFLLQDKLL